MNPFELILGIVLVVAVVRLLSQHRHGRSLGWTGTDDADETRTLRDEVRALKERVQVLERVITDTRSSAELDREIERLRDPR